MVEAITETTPEPTKVITEDQVEDRIAELMSSEAEVLTEHNVIG